MSLTKRWSDPHLQHTLRKLRLGGLATVIPVIEDTYRLLELNLNETAAIESIGNNYAGYLL